MKTLRILISDGMNRQGLAVARALKEAGKYRVYLAAEKDGLYGFFKKCINKLHVDGFCVLEKNLSDTGLVEHLIRLLRQKKIDALIPAGNSFLAISREKARLENYCRVLVEDYQKIMRFHDKSQTLDLVRHLKIPHPKTLLPENAEDLEAFAPGLAYPLVLKARKGAGATGVWYVNNFSELHCLYRRITETPTRTLLGAAGDHSRPMLQEYIPGDIYDVPVYGENGRAKLALCQKRLLMTPYSGGPGIVNMTMQHDELVDYAHKIFEAMQWNGVMQVEFKIDARDGSPKLLEVNPRFWGTTWLTIRAGFNYPHYLISRAFNRTVRFPKTYQMGLYGRWPLMEAAAVFQNPGQYNEKLKHITDFLKRFALKKCVYYLG